MIRDPMCITFGEKWPRSQRDSVIACASLLRIPMFPSGSIWSGTESVDLLRARTARRCAERHGSSIYSLGTRLGSVEQIGGVSEAPDVDHAIPFHAGAILGSS
jgi:hypothetical protein